VKASEIVKQLFFSLLLTPVLAIVSLTPAKAEIRTSIVEYRDGNTILEGYLAYDDEIKGPRPGVMVVHAWRGLGEYEKRRARELAELGYVAFAADIYGKGIRATNNQEAAKLAQIYRSNRQLMRNRANAGLRVLKRNRMVAFNNTAAIGYCFGGGVVLELARSGARVDGVVSFHGNLDTPDPKDARNIRAKVLVLHGASDPLVPIEQVDGFIAEMEAAEVDYQLVMYGNAVHSFSDPNAGDDPTTGVAYNAKADRRSWQDMKNFFAEIFQNRVTNK